jgi:hypothetical protein
MADGGPDSPDDHRPEDYRQTRSRVWPQEVAVGTIALRAELAVLRARRTDADQPERDGIAAGVEGLLDKADAAAAGRSPHYRWLRSWWHGNVIEAAFQSLHRAEAEIVALYDDDEVAAAVPEAYARLSAALDPGDQRLLAAAALLDPPAAARRPGHRSPIGPPSDQRADERSPDEERRRRLLLRKAVQIGHEAKDQQFARIRKFRNIVLLASVLILAFVVAFSVVVALNPQAVQFCFGAAPTTQHCATHEVGGPTSLDIWIVGLLGLLGGSLSAAVAIRNIRGTPTPYNLAVALAFLKVPTGALTAIGALIALKGDFVPGFSVLDSQGQILAYALAFGYAQQLLTGLIDRRALELVSDVPAKGGRRRSAAAAAGRAQPA